MLGPSIMREKVEVLEKRFWSVGIEAFGHLVAGAHVIDEDVASLSPQSALDYFGRRLENRK